MYQQMLQIKIRYLQNNYQLLIPSNSTYLQVLLKFHKQFCPISNRKIYLYASQKQIINLNNRVSKNLENQSFFLRLQLKQLQPLQNLGQCYKFYFGILIPNEFNQNLQSILSKKYGIQQLKNLFDHINWFFPLLIDQIDPIISIQQCKQFITNGIIGYRIYQISILYLISLGINKKKLGENQFELQYADIFKERIKTEKQNIQRMIKFLYLVGFRNLAIKFLLFLKGQSKNQTLKRRNSIKQINDKLNHSNIQVIQKILSLQSNQILSRDNVFVLSQCSLTYKIYKSYNFNNYTKNIFQLLKVDGAKILLQNFQHIFPLEKQYINDIKTIFNYQQLVSKFLNYALELLNPQKEQYQGYFQTISTFLLKIKLNELLKRLREKVQIIIK